MFDIDAIDPSRLKEVAAPFSMDVMREFFVDKTKVFLVNYEQCQLKGKSLLIYLSNLDIPCDIRFSSEVKLEEKFEMLKCYMESRNMFSLPSFTKTFAELLVLSKNIPSTLFRSTIFSKEELQQFLNDNQELIRKCVHFCDSLPLFAVSTTQAYRLKFPENAEASVDVIDDPFYVGQNVVDLFYLDGFFEVYFSEKPKQKAAFFKRQFRDQMFRGKSMFQYFANPNNSLMGMLVAISERKLERKDIESLYTQLS
jgi:hypothetical protein